MKFPLLSISVGLFAMVGLTGCDTPGQSAMAGAGVGAVMGGMLKGNGRDVARGAAIGAAGGYILGKAAENERSRGYYQGRMEGSGYAYVPPPPPPPPRYYSHYSYGYRMSYGQPSRTYGYVYSPYSGRLVSVRGIPHGAQVRDPYTGQVFLNP